MRSNLSSRMKMFHELLTKMWSKAWIVHQGLCGDGDAATPNPLECSDEVDATGSLQLLHLLNPKGFLNDENSEDVCRWGVAKVDTYAFGIGRPDASRDGVHYYAESGNKQFRMGNEIVVNVAGVLMSLFG